MKALIGEFLCDTNTAELLCAYEYTHNFPSGRSIRCQIRLFKAKSGKCFMMKREKPGRIFFRNQKWYINLASIEEIRRTLGRLNPDLFIKLFPMAYVLY